MLATTISGQKKAVVILEVMWDWRNVTSSAGYRERAPRHFSINPHNFTGRRLHSWLKDYPSFQVTNACPELVSSASGRGKPDAEWLRENLQRLAPFDLLLVCGAVAAKTYDRASAGSARIIEMPHPAMRLWSAQGIELVTRIINDDTRAIRIRFDKPTGAFVAVALEGETVPSAPPAFTSASGASSLNPPTSPRPVSKKDSGIPRAVKSNETNRTEYPSMTTLPEVIERYKCQFVERFGEDFYEQTFIATLNFTILASDISNIKSQAESDAYMEMVAKFILDIREAQP